MFEGMYVEKVLTQKYIRPYPQQPQETAGYSIGSQAIYRYSLKDSEYPTLTIPDPIYNGAGGMIKPGHYEIALSDSMEFLILLESKNPIAIIPVIKIEEDATEKARLNNKTVKKETFPLSVSNKCLHLPHSHRSDSSFPSTGKQPTTQSQSVETHVVLLTSAYHENERSEKTARPRRVPRGRVSERNQRHPTRGRRRGL